MTVLLQGGGEFSPGCLEMDADLVRSTAGPVVVTALAGTPGRDYDTATRNGVEHYRRAGAQDVVGAPDARSDREAALAVLRRARLIVLPGGSPSRLLGALRETGAGEVVTDLLAGGGAVMGSSAGAMVLGSWTVLPERPGPPLTEGLAAVPGVLVVPHWSGGRDDWLRAVDGGVPADTLVLGLREESGVLVEADTFTAVGVSPTRFVRQGLDLAVGRSCTRQEISA